MTRLQIQMIHVKTMAVYKTYLSRDYVLGVLGQISYLFLLFCALSTPSFVCLLGRPVESESRAYEKTA